MTESGRDPHREARRAGDSPVPAPGADSNSSSPADYVLGTDGKPIRDRYGRPVRRRQAQQRPPRAGSSSASAVASSPSASRATPRANSLPAQRAEETRFDVGAYMERNQRPTQNTGYRSTPAAPAPRRPTPEVPRSYRAPESAPKQRPHRRRKKANPIKQSLGCFGWAVAILLVCTLVFTLWTDSRLTRIEAMPAEQVAKTAGTNWLLVGSDSRQGLTEEEQAELGTGGDVGVGRTDTIMLLHIPSSGKAKLISIPRDSYVEVPGFGMDKINAAFTYGGPQLLTETVEQSTGLRINHYAEIGMGGLANVVDSVGGVDICVKEPIDDPLAGINLQAGCQELRGRDALGYVRTRATAMGDLDRVQRQREFFAALLDKITSPGTLINPFRTISLVNHTASSFIVGEKDHVWHLARVALAMASGVETETVPIGGFQDTTVGNVVLWDDEAAQQLWDSMK
ncbi:LCP family protein [Corynebacterium striatum]|uniref:LCP family protein n=1 Tax=Corynebacterium striatum TaxID=43770 RepID=UPI000D75E955|nr:LCP family protein [Corynebacterium striatum]PXY08185.1 LytR family transcriptional regulator [Corynebacterium striatum]